MVKYIVKCSELNTARPKKKYMYTFLVINFIYNELAQLLHIFGFFIKTTFVF